jgi:PBP1b-binding outer membrane lipoprotein LpoB
MRGVSIKKNQVTTRSLMSVAGLVLFLSGCAAKKDMSFTNRELVEELQRQQVEVRENRRGIAVILPHILFA